MSYDANRASDGVSDEHRRRTTLPPDTLTTRVGSNFSDNVALSGKPN